MTNLERLKIDANILDLEIQELSPDIFIALKSGLQLTIPMKFTDMIIFLTGYQAAGLRDYHREMIHNVVSSLNALEKIMQEKTNDNELDELLKQLKIKKL